MIHRDENGFSLLETILAISIILFGILSLMTLSNQSITTSEVTHNQFIAAQLAQEAVEAVRATRDSNWLAAESNPLSAPDWNEGLYTSIAAIPDYTATVTVDPDANAMLDFTADAFNDTCVGSAAQQYDCTRVWVHPSQFYIQGGEVLYPNFDTNLVERTPFQRLVTLNLICRDPADELNEEVVSSGDCITAVGGVYEQVGIDVVAEVQWSTNGETRSYILEEHLYDWQ